MGSNSELEMPKVHCAVQERTIGDASPQKLCLSSDCNTGNGPPVTGTDVSPLSFSPHPSSSHTSSSPRYCSNHFPLFFFNWIIYSLLSFLDHPNRWRWSSGPKIFGRGRCKIGRSLTPNALDQLSRDLRDSCRSSISQIYKMDHKGKYVSKILSWGQRWPSKLPIKTWP